MKKFTLLIALVVCSIGFSQSSLISYVEQNPNYAQQRAENPNINAKVNYVPQERITQQPELSKISDANSNNFGTILSGTDVESFMAYKALGRKAIKTQTPASNKKTVVLNQRSSGGVATFTTLVDFQAACSGGTLIAENFDNGPGVIMDCGPIISSAGDACFLVGELEDGFNVTASGTGGNSTVIVPDGSLGNTLDLVGANSFADYTVVTFTGPDDVFAVTLDIWNFNGTDQDYRVYDTGGALLDTFTLNNPVAVDFFFGIISPDAIGRVEIEGLGGSAELFGHLQFGDCGGGGSACTAGVYADRATYDTEAGATTLEDLAGGPVGIMGCDLVISDAGDTCFPAGEIQPGIEFTTNNGTANNMVFVEAGQFGLPNNAVGSNGFADYTILNFPNNDVNNFAFDLYGLIGGSTMDIRIFGTGGLITTETVTDAGGAGVFFGYIASETVVSVEIEDLTQGTAELVAQISFGECTSGVDPPGEVCSTAIPVGCGDVVVGETTTNTDSGGNPAPDEWYSYTGTGALENVTISLCDGGTDYDSVLRVFDACDGTEIAFNNDFCGFQSEVTFESDGTSTYYIMVEGITIASGNFSLEVSCVEIVANDFCENAEAISCGESVMGSTLLATDDSAVAPDCGTSTGAPGVWYVYQDNSGLPTDITLTTCSANTDYDTKISVYTGDCGAPPLTCVAGNDDDPTCPAFQSTVEFQSDGNTTYYILVHGFGSGIGNFELTMNCAVVPPPNDMIANSIDVDEIGFPYTDPSVRTAYATAEAGSPVGCDNAGARGVWYNFTPTGDGTATASIISPGATGGTSDVSAGLGAAPTNVSMGLGTSGDLSFTVNNGPLAGSYDAIAAAFGGEFTADLITGDTVLMIDDDTTGDPNDACDPLLNGADLSGKIAIARRGACAFTDKVISAQNEGAIAVIVINNQPGGPIIMGGTNPDITIPALMIGDEDGEALLASFDTWLGLSITSGAFIGSYPVLAAAFGGEFTTTLIEGETVLMIDDDTTGDPNDACDPLLNGADLSGKIAIARRGACAFTDKVIAAQNAGAIMVIVINNQPGGPIIMGGSNPDITIPALMIGMEDGVYLLNSSLAFNAVTFYTAPNENAVETDLVLVDWFENQCLPGIEASIPTVAGQAYYVFVANHEGITDIVIDGTNLGTEDNAIEGFVYYPNPTQSTLNLRAQDNIERVTMYNMLGQKVIDQNVDATTSQVYVAELETGIYIMKVSVNGQIGTYKILKQ